MFTAENVGDDGITCAQYPSMCDENAACVYSNNGRYTCVCNHGYNGNGRQCSEQGWFFNCLN